MIYLRMTGIFSATMLRCIMEKIVYPVSVRRVDLFFLFRFLRKEWVMKEIPVPSSYYDGGGFIAGSWYRATVLGDDSWVFWTCRALSRKELYPTTLSFINRGGAEYTRDDIDSIRKIRGTKS
jgi:hypothetical protein